MRARYTVLIEPTATGYSAWVPDLPGCVATGATPAAVRDAIASALGLHLEGLHAEGLPVPAPERFAATVEVPIPPAVPAEDVRSAARACHAWELISIDPAVRSGRPCFRGTRITLTDVLEYLAGGMSEAELLADFSDLEAAHLRAAYGYAADAVAGRVFPPE